MAHPYKAKILRQLGGRVADDMAKDQLGNELARAKRYLGARMSISEGPYTTEGREKEVKGEYERARKAVGLDRKRGGRK